MHTHDENDTRKKNFELPGSRAHYAPSLSFTINHMWLEIEPDLQMHTISCKQRLSIVTLQDSDTIELDAAELQVKRSEEHTSELQSRQYLVCRLLLEKKNQIS